MATRLVEVITVWLVMHLRIELIGINFLIFFSLCEYVSPCNIGEVIHFWL